MPKTMSSPDYEAESDGDDDMQVGGSEDVKPDVSQEAPRRITATEAWSQYRGEAAADSEDEPETDNDEGEALVVKTEEAPLPEGPQFEEYWPRRGAMAPLVNEINQDVGDLDLDASATQDKKPDADSFGRRVEDLGLGTSESLGRSESLELETDPDGLSGAPPGMGAGEDDQKAFDPDRPLAPFVAYFDTRAGAEKNDLPRSKASDRVQTLADSQCVPNLASLLSPPTYSWCRRLAKAKTGTLLTRQYSRGRPDHFHHRSVRGSRRRLD